MLNKLAKIVLGVMVSVVCMAGAKVSANAQTLFVADAYGIHMLDSDDANIPYGVMAYDNTVNLQQINNDYMALLQKAYGVPGNMNINMPTVAGINPMMPYLVEDSMMQGYNLYGNGGMFKLDENGQLAFNNVLFPWVSAENTMMYISQVHLGMNPEKFGYSYTPYLGYGYPMYYVH